MTIMNVLSLFGGLGLFLFGMQLMGEALEKAAGTRLKKLLGMVTGNRFLAMLAGITITAVVQSSSATTVMVVGFVNAGLMSLTQAVGVIMGANIGTTVTSLLLSVQIDFAAIFTFLGLILSNLPDKYRTAKQFGTITMGLGILFIGMNTMSGAMEPLRTWEGFQKAMASINNPILGVLIGAVLVVAESLEHFGRGGIIAVSHQLRGLLVVRRIAAGNREHYSYHKDCRKYLFDVFHIFSFLFLLSCGD